VKLAALRLRQRDGVSCGPAVAVVAGALLDPAYRRELTAPTWFAGEQGRVHGRVNRVWPRALGTTPMGMTRAISAQGAGCGVPYRWRLCRGLWGRRDAMADVLAAVEQERPVAMLVGNVIPRHWVLIVEASGERLRCYEPSSGEVRTTSVSAVRTGRLTGLGFPRAFTFVLPSNLNSNV
jgi:hypothetical protein